MATQPILQSVTLPWPDSNAGYIEDYGMGAVSIEMANGNYSFQILHGAKRSFALKWTAISDGDWAYVRAAYDALLSTGGANNFTAPTGSLYTVTPDTNNPALEATAINTPGGLRWNVSMRLREVRVIV